jgi:Flp pilus assembly protein TadG
MTRSIVLKLRAFVRKFGGSNAGNIAMIYALSLFPMLAAVGSAVDLTRAMVVKMRLGEALDSAGLAVGGSVGLSEAQMTAKAQKFFYANYPDDELGTVTSLNVTSSGYNNNLVTVSGTARVETAFMGLFGVEYLDVAVNVQVTRESKGLEIALVLDNTGSMGQSGKIQALKTATNELIGILFGDQDTPSHLKMSLVPFSQTVKVDTTTFLSNGWMDINGLSSSARLNFDNNKYAFAVWATMNNKSWDGCLEARPNGLEETDDPPVAGDSRWVPYFEPDGPDSSAYSGYTTYVSDGGTGNQDTRLRRSSKYVNQNKTQPNADCDMQKILPLTNNKTMLEGYVNGMIANGFTHIAIGAAWGWRTLSPTPPYTEGADYDDPDWQKAMVFLTDGLNTIDSNSTWHKSNYTAYNYLVRGTLGTTNANAGELEQDDRTRTVCGRIKDAGIRIYSILLQENSSRAKNLMRDCATDPSLYFESPTSAELEPVFQAIAQDLSNLRLSQ